MYSFHRLDNLIFHPDKPEVLAVLDWELSTLGDPISDLAYCCLAHYLRPDFAILRGEYLLTTCEQVHPITHKYLIWPMSDVIVGMTWNPEITCKRILLPNICVPILLAKQ